MFLACVSPHFYLNPNPSFHLSSPSSTSPLTSLTTHVPHPSRPSPLTSLTPHVPHPSHPSPLPSPISHHSHLSLFPHPPISHPTPHPTATKLLEEMLDNGFPLALESNILKELIKPPSIVRNVVNTLTGDSQ